MRRHRVIAGLAAAVLVLVQAAASALWVDGGSASMAYSAAALAAPTSPATAPGVCVVLSHDRIVVSWSASTSTWATGYEVARSTTSGGPYSVVGTVGAAQLSFSDGPLTFSTTYHYVVRATKNTWRSPDSAQVVRTTRSAACL